MKIGDLVKNKSVKKPIAGLVVDIVQKKCWRTHILGTVSYTHLTLPTTPYV